MAPSASRVLTMLEILQSHRRMTASDLAERLGVDERTVRRYATTLIDVGIPVTAERGRYGGFRLMPGFKLPPLMLTDEEAVAVVLGLVAADRLGLTAQAPATAAAEAKITRVLPAALAGRVAALRETTGFSARSRVPAAAEALALHADPPLDTDVLLTVGAAARARDRLTLAYRARNQRVTRRDFDPYGIVFHHARWYVVGLDHDSGEVRSFRVDRIDSAEPTGATFAPPADFDAVAHLQHQFARIPWLFTAEVLFDARIDDVRQQIPPHVAELIDTPTGVLMRCRAHNLQGLARMLASLTWPFTVVGPDRLRETIAEHATRLMACAARRSPDHEPSPGTRGLQIGPVVRHV